MSEAVELGVLRLREALRRALEYIDAIPSDTPLPTMPGFDRDYVNGLLASPPVITNPAELEPVAWPEAQLIEFIERNTRRGRNGAYIGDVGAFVRLLLTRQGLERQPLYTRPVALPDREAVARKVEDLILAALYDHPHKPAPAGMQSTVSVIADDITALLSASTPKGHKLVPVEPLMALLRWSDSDGAAWSDFAPDPEISVSDTLFALLSASDGAGTEGGVG